MNQEKSTRVTVAGAPAAIPGVAVVVVSAYIAAQMLADMTSVKIGQVFGLAVDMGTFIYPITFTLRDLVHKQLGKRNTQILIITAAAVNIFMVLYTNWTAGVPTDLEADPGGEFGRAYSMVWGPLWRITMASIIAEVVSELTDTEVYHWFVTRITRGYQWLRVLVSNSISVPVDNAIFALLAFAPLPGLQDHFLTAPWSVVADIFIFNLLVKLAVTLVSLPLIYLVPERNGRLQ
ncbi:MAG TPA: queuosine precursor transporter [Candidatus Sulfomarinibacteraceae bacterium]|nr:queuosine precursor transporter [Candidatus Sulfomarinibacteraceae bacterium]